MRLVPKALGAPLLLFAVAVSGTAEAQDAAANTTSAPPIRGAGSTFAAPIIEAWLGAYAEEHPAFEASYAAIGSGDGIERFLAGEIDFGASDAPLEAGTLPKEAVQVPVTAGAISLVYNLPDVDEPLALARDVYADIFLGRIIRWDDPRIVASNPGVALPAKLIQVVARQDGSGTTFALTDHLSAVSEPWRTGFGAAKRVDWPGGAMLARGNEGVAQRVRLTRGAIGYVESGLAARLGLSSARLENAAGATVAPSIEAARVGLDTTASGGATALAGAIVDPSAEEAYPLITYTWWLQHRRPDDPRASSAEALLRWALTDGQALAEPLGYVALPERVVDAALAELGGAGS